MVIQKELELVFDEFNLGEYDRTKDEMQGLRYSANDLEKVITNVTDEIVKDTDIEEDTEELSDVVKTSVYAYYLMLHFTDVYLTTGDFMGLSNYTFESVWKKIHIKDKSKVIEMVLMLEDTMVIVHGMYLLIAQIERLEQEGK